MKTGLNKYSDGKLVTEHGAKHYVRVVYAKATTRSLTTSGSIGLVHWRMCELGWLVAMRIEYVNHLVHKIL